MKARAKHTMQVRRSRATRAGSVSVDDLIKQGPGNPPKLISRAKLTRLAAKLAKRRVTLASAPVFEVTPQHPFVEGPGYRGSMAFWDIVVWSSIARVIYMDHVSPAGDHYGEVGFEVPANGTYLIVANFAGATLTLTTPWGAFSATGSPNVPTAATALWNVTSGNRHVVCKVTCTSGTYVVIYGFQVFAVP